VEREHRRFGRTDADCWDIRWWVADDAGLDGRRRRLSARSCRRGGEGIAAPRSQGLERLRGHSCGDLTPLSGLIPVQSYARMRSWPMPNPAALPMTEADLQRLVTDAATALGWHWVDFRPARTPHGWSTRLGTVGRGLAGSVPGATGDGGLLALGLGTDADASSRSVPLAHAQHRGRHDRPSSLQRGG
jgi:hypothetical protein